MKVILSENIIKVRNISDETKRIGYYQKDYIKNTWYANFDYNGTTYEYNAPRQSDIRDYVSIVVMEG